MKRFIGFISGVIATASIALPAFAQTTGSAPTIVMSICPEEGGPFAKLCTLTAGSFSNVVSAVVTLLLIAAVVISLVFLIWGGIKWILSGGDKTAVESARSHIIGAIVGLVIAFAAFFVLKIVLNFFNLGDITSLKLPQFVK